LVQNLLINFGTQLSNFHAITRHLEDAFKHWITLKKTKWKGHKTEEKLNAFKPEKENRL
jgi:hypothetical protein